MKAVPAVLILGAMLMVDCRQTSKGRKEDRRDSGGVEDDAEGTGIGQQLFRLGMDENGNGKVTRKELEKWFAREGDTVVSDGIDYFAVLDINGDGSITPKEADNFMSLVQAASSETGSNFGDGGDEESATGGATASFMGEDESEDDREEL